MRNIEENNNPMQEVFDKIVKLGDLLDDNGIDFVKYKAGTTKEVIQKWENSCQVILPDDYKSMLLLANGLRYQGAEVTALEKIERLEIPDEYKGYYQIGELIGDGSMILTDGKGEFYYGDHIYGIEKATFMDFIDKWFIKVMLDDLRDNDISLEE